MLSWRGDTFRKWGIFYAICEKLKSYSVRVVTALLGWPIGRPAPGLAGVAHPRPNLAVKTPYPGSFLGAAAVERQLPALEDEPERWRRRLHSPSATDAKRLRSGKGISMRYQSSHLCYYVILIEALRSVFSIAEDLGRWNLTFMWFSFDRHHAAWSSPKAL